MSSRSVTSRIRFTRLMVEVNLSAVAVDVLNAVLTAREGFPVCETLYIEGKLSVTGNGSDV